MTTNRAHVLLWTDNTAPYVEGIKAAGLADRIALETLPRKEKPSVEQFANTEVLMATAVPPGEEPAEEGSTDPPDVEHAGGRWGKAGDDRAGHGGLSLQPPSVPQPAGWRDGPIPRRR